MVCQCQGTICSSAQWKWWLPAAMEDKVARFKNGGPSLNLWLQAGEFWTEKVAAEGWRLVQAVAGNGQQQDLQRRVRPPTIWTNAHKFRPVYRREQVLWKRVYRRSDPLLFSHHPIPVRHWIRGTYAIRWVTQGRLKVKRRFKEVYNNFVLAIHNSWLQRLWKQTYKTYKVTVIKFNQNPKSLHKATSYCCSNKELLLHVSLAESLQEVRVIHELLHD